MKLSIQDKATPHDSHYGASRSRKNNAHRILAPKLKAVLFNADEVRANLNNANLGSRWRIALSTLGAWDGYVIELLMQNTAIADFICPTVETRHAFGSAFIIWLIG